ncbi:hypothetical protein [Chromobacterium sp. ASV23]|uniref:hypothetical protein n=1 Tax=Chromobacterium sp. ASV23 TaxID=2795110 RepID=UPI0018EBA419|nr:hypothetical protein [Chromobacterium sp. ASV23]
MTQQWKEVSKDEFFKAIGPRDVSPTPVGRYPYTSLFKTRAGAVVGKIEGYFPEGSALPRHRHWLPA